MARNVSEYLKIMSDWTTCLDSATLNTTAKSALDATIIAKEYLKGLDGDSALREYWMMNGFGDFLRGMSPVVAGLGNSGYWLAKQRIESAKLCMGW